MKYTYLNKKNNCTDVAVLLEELQKILLRTIKRTVSVFLMAQGRNQRGAKGEACPPPIKNDPVDFV